MVKRRTRGARTFLTCIVHVARTPFTKLPTRSQNLGLFLDLYSSGVTQN